MRNKIFMKATWLVLALVCCVSCKEDEETKLEFRTDEKTISLQNANLYYRLEGSYEGAVNYTYRDYLISDGELIEGQNGWSIDDYSNATYFIGFELATADPQIPTAGEYPLHRFWDNVTDGSNISYIFANVEGEFIDTPGTTPPPIIKIAGGIEPGDEMIIQFEGEVAYRLEGGNLDRFNCQLYFKGKVIDRRD